MTLYSFWLTKQAECQLIQVTPTNKHEKSTAKNITTKDYDRRLQPGILGAFTYQETINCLLYPKLQSKQRTEMTVSIS